MSSHHIVVGTPCFGGVVGQDYAMSLLALQSFAAKNTFDMSTILLGNDALIPRARSAIVARFLDHPAATHLLFVDADISFQPEQVKRMLDADKDFVAGFYPAKVIDWGQIPDRLGQTAETMDEAGLIYVGSLCEGPALKFENGFGAAMYAGTGFQLIKRGVFERMIKAHPELRYGGAHAFPRQPQASENLYALFDCMIDQDTGVYLSEDYAFCRRWKAIGGEIWLDLNSRLTHTGAHSFRGNAAAHFTKKQL